MAREMTERLRRDGIARGRMRVVASADCRFLGQGYELSVPVSPRTERGLASLAARFRALHLRTYGHADPGQRVEVVTIRLAAFGALPSAEPASVPRGTRAAGDAEIGVTRARLPGSAAVRDLPVLDRGRLLAGNVVTGPAIVHQLDATTLVLPGQRARIDERGSLWLTEAR